MQRGGRNGFRTLVRILRIMDDDGNRQLNRYEFLNGLNTYGIFPSPLEMDELMIHFDRDNSGQITVSEFCLAVVGEMSNFRKNLVMQAYTLLDANCDGIVKMEDITRLYDASRHPEVLAGQKTIKIVMQEFIKMWDKNSDDVITPHEFLDYYNDLSAGIDNDQYFELMVRNGWHLSGGEGAAQCTSCRRVLVVHQDGHETVEEIKNDLGIGPKDEARILERLRQQGINDIKEIKIYG
jgi:Ca2+-binding EF-hand superfamily protein